MSVGIEDVTMRGAGTMAEELPDTSTARIHADLLDMARLVCAHRKVRGRRLKLTEYLDAKLRGPITKDYKEVLREIREGD